MTVVQADASLVVLGSRQSLRRPAIRRPARARCGAAAAGEGSCSPQPGDVWVDWWIPADDARWSTRRASVPRSSRVTGGPTPGSGADGFGHGPRGPARWCRRPPCRVLRGSRTGRGLRRRTQGGRGDPVARPRGRASSRRCCPHTPRRPCVGPARAGPAGLGDGPRPPHPSDPRSRRTAADLVASTGRGLGPLGRRPSFDSLPRPRGLAPPSLTTCAHIRLHPDAGKLAFGGG